MGFTLDFFPHLETLSFPPNLIPMSICLPIKIAIAPDIFQNIFFFLPQMNWLKNLHPSWIPKNILARIYLLPKAPIDRIYSLSSCVWKIFLLRCNIYIFFLQLWNKFHLSLEHSFRCFTHKNRRRIYLEGFQNEWNFELPRILFWSFSAVNLRFFNNTRGILIPDFLMYVDRSSCRFFFPRSLRRSALHLPFIFWPALYILKIRYL